MLQTSIPSLNLAWDATPLRLSLGDDHFQEWLASGVDPELIRLNVETLTDTDPNPNTDHPYPIAERLNWTITRFGHKARNRLRGWWVSGLDPFEQWQRMVWGRFKPDAHTPVMDQQKGKPAKYLSPSGDGTSRVTFLDVPVHLWKQVAQRYNTSLSTQQMAEGFWQWVQDQNIPIVLTEGEKKAGCLLSLGYAAIALPGIFNGYRKDPLRLIDDLNAFATPERQVYICFDYETKPKTIQNIQTAIAKTGRLLLQAGCQVKVISLPGPDKGVDDFIVTHGAPAFHPLYTHAHPLDHWYATQLWALTVPPHLTLNQQYLGSLPFPDSGLVCIKSPKGSGKTQALEPFIRQQICQGRKILVATHRVQLGKAICHRLGLDWVEERVGSDTADLLGFGLCVDSLHHQSQARFNPQQWKGAILILDEAEQVLWHALNSSTCYEHRVKILDNLRELVQLILASGGLIILQDADLSDLSIDYIRNLAETPIEPWVILNEWQPEQPCPTYFYDTPTPAPLLARIPALLAQGPVFLCLDSQKAKGRFSSVNLEALFRQRYPDLRILRIDSETVADPTHPAYGIIEHLNQAVVNYDLVIATPTIGTGVDIHVLGYFQAVVGIFQGAIPDAEARQALARVREPVPRYIWARPFGAGKVGNGSCNYREVAHSTRKDVQYNIHLLLQQDFDLDQAYDPITLRTWAKMAARVNVSLWSYRQELKHGLLREGHQVTVVTETVAEMIPPMIESLMQELSAVLPGEDIRAVLLEDLRRGALQFPGFEYLPLHHSVTLMEEVVTALTEVKELNQQAEAISVVNAPDISATEYEALHEKRAKTPAERHAQHKYELQRRYPIPLTPEIKIKDDAGWFPKLRLHYYLMHHPQLVRQRDLKEWQAHLERGGGKLALQDVKLMTAQVELLRGLGIPELLHPERQVRATDADVERLALLCWRCPQDIKTVLHVTITEKMTPIQIVQVLLSKLDVKLTCVGRDLTPEGRRGGVRVYQYLPEWAELGHIFALWQQRDADLTEPLLMLNPEAVDPPPDIYVNNTDRNTAPQPPLQK